MFSRRRSRSPEARRRRQAGQSASEYMLVISVMAVAAAGVTYTMFDSNNGPVKQELTKLLGSGSDTADQRNVPDQVQRGYISPDPLNP